MLAQTSLGVLFFVGKIFRAIWLLRGPFFVAITAAMIINAPQFKEILFIYIEDRLANTAVQAICATLLLILLSWTLWRIGRDLFLVSDFVEIYNFRFAKWIRCVIPALIAALPVLGVGVALRSEYITLSRLEIGSPLTPESDYQVSADQVATAAERAKPDNLNPQENATYNAMMNALQKAGLLEDTFRWLSLLVILGSAFIVFLGLTYEYFKADDTIANASALLSTELRWGWVWLISLLFFVYLFGYQSGTNIIFTSINSTDIARQVGTPAITFLFFIYLTIILGLMTGIFDKYSIPVLSLVIAGSVIFSYYNLNNNHSVQTIARPQKPTPPVNEAFVNWLEQRPEWLVQSAIKEKGYFPVYLFAMEGGGHYASTFASLTLAKLIDRCPSLRHHIFAISGVSGGGVGAGIFVAALKSELLKPNSPIGSDRCELTLPKGSTPSKDMGPLEEKITEFQSDEFLSPLAASALFGDLPLRALPVTIGSFDRARAFEAALESVAGRLKLKDQNGRNLFKSDFLDHWSPAAGTPMLILNTTRVQTGEPIVIAPFHKSLPVMNGGELRSLYDEVLGTESIRFSTALGLTARFPILMPVGTFQNGENKYYDLVDGGYFENSGADALIALLNELSFYKHNPELLNLHLDNPEKHRIATELMRKVKFKVIVVHQDSAFQYERERINEVSAPLNALYRVRRQRASMAVDRIFAHDDVDARKIRLESDLISLPLGWQLSKSSINNIANVVGVPEQCAPNGLQDITKLRPTLLSVVEKAKSSLAFIKATEERDKAAKAIGKLFYYMTSNRCILREIIENVSVSSKRTNP